MDPILIYSPAKTGRVRYIFRLVFEDILKVPYELTDDQEEFLNTDRPRFIYGDKAFSNELFFKSSGMLFKKGVEAVDLEPVEFEGMK